MRKYFLLGAVALMISGTANATGYASGVFATTVNLKKASAIECSQALDFGTVIVTTLEDSSGTVEILGKNGKNVSSGSNGIFIEGTPTPAKCTISGDAAYAIADTNATITFERLNPVINSADTGVEFSTDDSYVAYNEEEYYEGDGNMDLFIGGKLSISELYTEGEFTENILMKITY
ncbi:MAG: DUF4402 domain-containing protein [Alphaproteobacteria bacterium]|nr:DUF4402 domain-containing protein [Alphaproteobacteria bacterium]